MDADRLVHQPLLDSLSGSSVFSLSYPKTYPNPTAFASCEKWEP